MTIICRWNEYSSEQTEHLWQKSKRHVLRILRIPPLSFFRLVKRRTEDRNRLDTFVGDTKFREVAATEIFPLRGCAQVRAGSRNMTVNFSRIHRAERMECPFIVSKRAASRQKPWTGIPFLRPNYSCHYTCGFLERAYSRISVQVSKPRDSAGDSCHSFFPLPFLSFFRSFFICFSFFFLSFSSNVHAQCSRLCGSGFQIWLDSLGLQFCNP